jgi:hypothetical protein
MTTPLHARQRGPLGWALLLLAPLLLSSRPSQAQTVDTYSFAASTGTYTPLVGGTPVTTLLADDALSGAITLPFSFVFDGTAYTSCKVSSNGWLTFNASASGTSLDNNLATGTASERPRVAPFWDDLDGRLAGANASYATTGTAPNRVFTFEWLNFTRLNATTSPAFSMQVQLVEGTNEVRFVYRREASPVTTATASIGLSGAGLGSGSFLSLNNPSGSPAVSSTLETTSISTSPATGQIYRFTPPVPSACPTPRNLNSTNANGSALITYTSTSATPGPFTIQYGPAGFDPSQPSTPTNFYITITSTQLYAILSPLAAGTTYQFYVTQNCGGTAGDSNRSNAGTFTTDPNPAPNDNCAQAIALPISTTCSPQLNGTVFGATASTPALSTTCSSSTAADVWFTFVANGNSQTITFSPQFAGIMDVRTGNCTTSNSIFCIATGVNGTSTNNIGGLVNGQTYYIRVYASGATQPVASSSSFSLCVQTGPPTPANDECTGAIPLTVGVQCAAPVQGTVVAASQSLPPTSGCTATTANDVWFSFVATGTTQVLTFAPGFAAVMNVRSGPCPTSTSVSCASVGVNGTINPTISGLTLGQTYYVRVYASGAQPTPANATFLLCASGRPLATRAQADTEALLVYPNPSNSGQLTLRLAASAGAGQATLLNALGQTVRHQALNGAAEQTFSTRSLAAGLYTLRVTVGEQVLTRKVVLE